VDFIPDEYTQVGNVDPLCSGRRSEAIPALSADGLKVRLRAGNEFHPMERGLKVRANHGRTHAPVICADLRPATLCCSPETQPGRRFRLRGSCVRTGLVLARTFGPKWLRKMCILVRIEIHG
jgi:hypothetical protein